MRGKEKKITFWKSQKTEFSACICHLFVLWQFGFLHTLGSVYLNCCSTSLISLLQTRQRKLPWISSGLTSVVLVIVPMKANNLPRFPVFKSLILMKFLWLFLRSFSNKKSTCIWVWAYKTKQRTYQILWFLGIIWRWNYVQPCVNKAHIDNTHWWGCCRNLYQGRRDRHLKNRHIRCSMHCYAYDALVSHKPFHHFSWIYEIL